MPTIDGDHDLAMVSRGVVKRRLSGINLNLLTALDALLTERSVTRAADRVGVTQSSMSHSLSQLRDLLEDPLLVRAGQGMRLTPRAEALAGPLRHHLGGLFGLLTEGPDFDPARATRTLRIATADFVAIRLLPSLLERLAHAAPGVDVAVRPLDAARYAADLEQGAVDLVIGPSAQAGRNLGTRLLPEDPFVCVVREGHPVLSQPELTLKDYLQLEHLLVSPSERGRAVVDEALAALGHTRRIRARVHAFAIAPAVVARTDLVLTTPAGNVEGWAGRGLSRFAPPLALAPLRLALSWHERDALDPAHRWLRDQVADCLGA